MLYICDSSLWRPRTEKRDTEHNLIQSTYGMHSASANGTCSRRAPVVGALFFLQGILLFLFSFTGKEQAAIAVTPPTHVHTMKQFSASPLCNARQPYCANPPNIVDNHSLHVSFLYSLTFHWGGGYQFPDA